MIGCCVGYEILDTSGDVAVRATGRSMEEAMAQTALGMYSLITEPAGVVERMTLSTGASGADASEMLVNWLNDLIFRFDAHGFVGRRVSSITIKGETLNAALGGERFDPDRHGQGLLIKAATYHGLRLERTGGGWLVEVLFDI